MRRFLHAKDRKEAGGYEEDHSDVVSGGAGRSAGDSGRNDGAGRQGERAHKGLVQQLRRHEPVRGYIRAALQRREQGHQGRGDRGARDGRRFREEAQRRQAERPDARLRLHRALEPRALGRQGRVPGPRRLFRQMGGSGRLPRERSQCRQGRRKVRGPRRGSRADQFRVSQGPLRKGGSRSRQASHEPGRNCGNTRRN